MEEEDGRRDARARAKALPPETVAKIVGALHAGYKQRLIAQIFSVRPGVVQVLNSTHPFQSQQSPWPDYEITETDRLAAAAMPARIVALFDKNRWSLVTKDRMKTIARCLGIDPFVVYDVLNERVEDLDRQLRRTPLRVEEAPPESPVIKAWAVDEELERAFSDFFAALELYNEAVTQLNKVIPDRSAFWSFPVFRE